MATKAKTNTKATSGLRKTAKPEAQPTPEPQPQPTPAPTAKPKKVAKKPKPPVGNFRYAGSVAEAMDNALLKGGKLDELAASIKDKSGKQIKPSVLRSHAKFRATHGGKYRLEENNDHYRLFLA